MRLNSPHINHQSIDGEVVIINLENGAYYSLLGVAAALWPLAISGWTRDEIAAAVAIAYPGAPDAAAQAGSFLDELAGERLLVEGETPDPRAEPVWPADYAVPLLEKFTDMQELLLLDPIHEVDAIGWPHKPTGS